VAVRELFREHPDVAKRRTMRNSYVSVVMDYAVWPCLSVLFHLVRFMNQPIVKFFNLTIFAAFILRNGFLLRLLAFLRLRTSVASTAAHF